MRSIRVCLTFSLLIAGTLVAQDAARLRDTVTYLASRDLLGRKTGTAGGDSAARYIAERFRTLGLTTVPGGTGETAYHHLYPFTRALQPPAEGHLTFGSTRLQMGPHAEVFGGKPQAGETLFAGYGRASDLRRLSLSGRWVIALEGAPKAPSDEQMLDPEASLAAKLRSAKEGGALGLVLIETNHPENHGPDYWNRISPGRVFRPGLEDADLVGFPLIIVHPEGGRLLNHHLLQREALAPENLQNTLAQDLGRLQPSFESSTTRAGQAANLVSQIPGTDPLLKNQVIVVTAHFDHLGGSASSYYPGADDNASGTAGLLELAQLLAGSSPKRTILLVAFSGEEDGLLGSQAFVANPPVALSRIVAEINLDMIGRNGARTLYLTPAAISGQVTTLVSKARELALTQDLDTNKGIDQYWRQSDHYPFAQKGIPSIFFNTGDHPDLHRTTDTAALCDFPKMAKVVGFAKALVDYWANTSEKPQAVPSSTYNAWSWPVRGSSQTGSLAIGSQPQSLTVQAGQPATFSVSVQGGKPPYAYQWYRNSAVINGATSASYTFTAQASDNGTTHKAVVTDSASTPAKVTSNEALLTIGTGPIELLKNGGFEQGSTSWSGTTGRIGNWSAQGQPAFQGSQAAWLGGKGRTTSETLYQTVTIPANSEVASCTFQLHIDTAETEATAYDRLGIQVRSTSGQLLSTLATFSNLNKASGHQLRTFDLKAYRGRTVRVHFALTEDASLQTSFVLDNVSFKVQ